MVCAKIRRVHPDHEASPIISGETLKSNRKTAVKDQQHAIRTILLPSAYLLENGYIELGRNPMSVRINHRNRQMRCFRVRRRSRPTSSLPLDSSLEDHRSNTQRLLETDDF